MKRLLLFLALSSLLLFLLVHLRGKTDVQQFDPPLSVTGVLGKVPAEGFARAVKPRSFTFPADHGPHPQFRNEWWYFTGNLRTSDGRRFGYQLTFFRNALIPDVVPRESRWGFRDVYLAHFTVTDVDRRGFLASERFSRDALELAGARNEPLRVHLEEWEAVETERNPWSMRLAAAEENYSIDLQVKSLKPPVLNGEGGLSQKGRSRGNASYYYSVSRLATTGTISLKGETFTVSGLTWFDREWSTSALEPEQSGWDWFSLQLEDGRDLMLYRLRRKDGSVDRFSGGTVVEADGSSRPLSFSEAYVEVTSWWESSKSAVRYPGRWRIKVPSERLDLDVVPLVPDQELNLSLRYWEGAVSARGSGGSPGGSGYVELAGYGSEDEHLSVR